MFWWRNTWCTRSHIFLTVFFGFINLSWKRATTCKAGIKEGGIPYNTNLLLLAFLSVRRSTSFIQILLTALFAKHIVVVLCFRWVWLTSGPFPKPVWSSHCSSLLPVRLLFSDVAASSDLYHWPKKKQKQTEANEFELSLKCIDGITEC